MSRERTALARRGGIEDDRGTQKSLPSKRSPNPPGPFLTSAQVRKFVRAGLSFARGCAHCQIARQLGLRRSVHRGQHRRRETFCTATTSNPVLVRRNAASATVNWSVPAVVFGCVPAAPGLVDPETAASSRMARSVAVAGPARRSRRGGRDQDAGRRAPRT